MATQERTDREEWVVMTVSIGRVNVDYYLKNTAAGDGVDLGRRDLTAYYTESGAPAGTWWGKGLAAAHLTHGTTVEKADARALYEDFTDPVTGENLGRSPIKATQAPKDAKTPAGKTAKTTREAVSGFDLTFSVPKSVSAVWALAPAPLQAQLHAAHRRAVEDVLGWVEQEIIQTRSGHAGVAKVDTEGVLASLFDHWDSRAGDPQLHTHAVIANRVQRADGTWLTLDSHALHRHVVAISETFNSALFDRLYEAVGAVAVVGDGDPMSEAMEAADVLAAVSSETGAGGLRAELAGVPEELLVEFSQRSSAIAAETDRLVGVWRADHGAREPSAAVVLQLRQQATLSTRTAKSTDVHSLPELMAQWRDRATAIGVDPAGMVGESTGLKTPVIRADDIDEDLTTRFAAAALAETSARRTTFSRANLLASTERLLRGVRTSSFEERRSLTDRVVDEAIAQAVALSPDRMGQVMDHDRRLVIRGRSVFDRGDAALFTTADTLAAEQFLIDQTHAAAPSLDRLATARLLELSATRSGHGLANDQAAAAETVLSSGHRVDAIIGPAGTGKTTTMRAVRDVWMRAHGDGSVTGLAPSAVAAAVLGDEIGAPTENVAKWLWETEGPGAAARARRVAQLERAIMKLDPRSRGGARALTTLNAKVAVEYAAQAAYQLRPGHLVIVDEASMVDTAALARLAHQCDRAGAKMLLVGDPAQLEAVEAGGFLGWMDRHNQVSRLRTVWRFSNQWERAASLRLRVGDTTVLGTYDQEDRIVPCPEGSAADAAYQRWLQDAEGGGIDRTLLIAADNDTVSTLNTRAQLDRVTTGQVSLSRTVDLRDGYAGVGDLILARRNSRAIVDTAGQFVKNGTRLLVSDIDATGAVIARRTDTDATVVLDPAYLHQHVELGYAVTAHRAQGVTVDTAHAVVTPGQSRELFYVAMTRGRHRNTAFVDIPDPEEHATADQWGLMRPVQPEDALAVLTGVMGRETAERTAHEMQDAEHGWANDFARLSFEWDYLSTVTAEDTAHSWATANLPADRIEQVTTDPAWATVVGRPLPATLPPDVDPGTVTAVDIAALCGPPIPADPVTLAQAITPVTAEQARLAHVLHRKLTDRLHALTPQLGGEDEPAWVDRLRRDHPGEDLHRLVSTVTAWREISHQQDAAEPWGHPPQDGDRFMRAYWDRAHEGLAQQRPAAGTVDAWEGADMPEEPDWDGPPDWALEELPPDLEIPTPPEPVTTQPGVRGPSW